jgi:hypothetical protein
VAAATLVVVVVVLVVVLVYASLVASWSFRLPRTMRPCCHLHQVAARHRPRTEGYGPAVAGWRRLAANLLLRPVQPASSSSSNARPIASSQWYPVQSPVAVVW